MLQEDLFTILSIQKEDTFNKVMVKLNAAHSIFGGHFPGQPVVPGACLLQMVKEVMQIIIGSNLQLVNAHHLKFISVIDPSKNETLEMILTHSLSENNKLVVSATLSYDATSCFKFSGIFKID